MSERERFEEGMPGLLKAMRWAYDNFYIKGYSNSDEREGYISALEDDLPVLFGQVDDLVALVARLARSLRKATPADALADGAMDYLRRKGLNPSPLRTVPEPGQAASGSSQGARSDEAMKRFGFKPWSTLEQIKDDEDLELYVQARIEAEGVGQPEAPTAAPLADEQATAFLLELRAVVAETMKRPGEAVPIPARVRTEVAKFMRDQPSVFDRLPYGEVVALAEFCGGVVAHPPARSGAGSEEGQG